jgi:hypothetical protein
MEPLVRESMIDTPGIILDKENNVFEIWGRSLPENVMVFYRPILEWLNNYANDPNPETIVNMKFIYFNSSTSKVIADILLILERMIKEQKKVKVYWHYIEDDDDMHEAGQDYADIFLVPFEFFPYKPIRKVKETK